jgi:hypothetical protein
MRCAQEGAVAADAERHISLRERGERLVHSGVGPIISFVDHLYVRKL